MSQDGIVQVGADEGYALIEPLLSAHYQESCRFKDLAVVKPMLDLYREIDAKDGLLCLVAIIGGKAVGYAVSFMKFNVHYRDFVYCSNDVLFVLLEHRKSRVGLQLIKETERRARAGGAKMMLWHAKPDTPMDELMPRLKCERFEHTWSKRL